INCAVSGATSVLTVKEKGKLLIDHIDTDDNAAKKGVVIGGLTGIGSGILLHCAVFHLPVRLLALAVPSILYVPHIAKTAMEGYSIRREIRELMRERRQLVYTNKAHSYSQPCL